MKADQALLAQLCERLTEWGASIYGVADLSLVRDYLRQDYADAWENYTGAISVGVFFPTAVVDELKTGPTRTYQAYYDIINARLNDIALRTALWLEAAGFAAFPVPASQRVGKNKEAAIFSHRLAAHTAGLGWIGRSLSLITPEAGPRIRLVSVLTDAPLPFGRPLDFGCPPNCRQCQEACPAQAIKGVDFQPGQAIEERFDALACAAYLRQVRQSFGQEVCGRCVAACPMGRRKNK
jgi:epoxyqueuosine reductase